jgi:hypothetical protein
MGVQIIYPADRAAWLAARQQDVTASVAGALLGVHPFTTPYQLWAEKTGRLKPDNRSSLEHQIGQDEIEISPLEMGLFLEGPVVEIIRKVRPLWKVEYPLFNRYYRDPKARLGATPDAFVTDYQRTGNGIIQIKTLGEDPFRREWQDPDTKEVVLPLWIAVQAIIEADLTGSTFAYVAALVRGRTNRLFLIEVPVHAGIKRRIRDEVAAFWRMVREGREPPADFERDGDAVLDVYRISEPGRRDLTGDANIDALCGQFDYARSMARDFQKQADQIKPRIVAALGNYALGETQSWEISAPTTYRAAHRVEASEGRTVRLKAKPLKENADGDEF